MPNLQNYRWSRNQQQNRTSMPSGHAQNGMNDMGLVLVHQIYLYLQYTYCPNLWKSNNRSWHKRHFETGKHQRKGMKVDLVTYLLWSTYMSTQLCEISVSYQDEYLALTKVMEDVFMVHDVSINVDRRYMTYRSFTAFVVAKLLLAPRDASQMRDNLQR